MMSPVSTGFGPVSSGFGPGPTGFGPGPSGFGPGPSGFGVTSTFHYLIQVVLLVLLVHVCVIILNILCTCTLYVLQHQNQAKVFQGSKCIVRIFLLCLELQALNQAVCSKFSSEDTLYMCIYMFCLCTYMYFVIPHLANEKSLSSGTSRGTFLLSKVL